MLISLEASLDDRVTKAADHMLTAAALDPEFAGAQGREARFLKHPLMAPTRLISRVGPAQLWVGWLAVLFLLPRVWPGAPMGWIVLVYILFAIYSWTVPFLLRKWMTSQGRL